MDRIKAIITKTGVGLWLGLTANVLAIACALSFLSLPSHTFMHGGATEFSLMVCWLLLMLMGLPYCVIDLIKHRRLGFAGIILLFTASICAVRQEPQVSQRVFELQTSNGGIQWLNRRSR